MQICLLGVSERKVLDDCDFRENDIFAKIKTPETYDVVVMHCVHKLSTYSTRTNVEASKSVEIHEITARIETQF